MPNRIIRESILSSEAVCSLGWPEEVFYRRLMSIVDDYGRCEANAQLLRARCYPLQTDQVRVADITRWMAACQKSGLILLYEIAGKGYLEVQKFGQQQRSASKCPDPPAENVDCDRLIAIDSKVNQMQTNEHLGVVVSGVVSEVDKKPGGPPESGVNTPRVEFPKQTPVANAPLAQNRTQLDPEFTPDEPNRRTAIGLKLDVDAERERFVAHYTATGDWRANWQAQFRKWILDSMQHQADAEKRQRAPPRNGSPRTRQDQQFIAARSIFGTGENHERTIDGDAKRIDEPGGSIAGGVD